MKDTLSQHKIVSSWNLDKWKHQVTSCKKFNNHKTRCKLIVLGEREGSNRISFYGVFL